MVMFSGIIVQIFSRKPVGYSVAAMIAVGLLLPVLDGYRAIRLGSLWKKNANEIPLNMKVLSVELLLVVSITLYSFYG